MNNRIKQLADASRGKITAMEQRLSKVLKPVTPRKEFVHGVARRIQSAPRVVERITDWHLTAMLVAGLVSLALFLALVGKALLSLLGKKRTA
jgi:hypothetical protein